MSTLLKQLRHNYVISLRPILQVNKDKFHELMTKKFCL